MNMELKVEKKPEEEKIMELTENPSKITDEKIEASLNYEALSEDEKKAVEEFNSKMDILDSTQILQYGAAAQNKISMFSDTVLRNVKTKDVDEVGGLLAGLVAEIKSFDASIDTNDKKGLFGLFRKVKKDIDTIIAKYGKVEKNIDTIQNNLEKNKVQLLKDINIFDTMYDKNLEYFKEISLYIIAGERKLEELRTRVLPELKKKAEESNDQLDAQKVQDMENQINRFEKKIHDLKITRIISIQMAPQIRILQNNDAELIEKIQSSITNTIPLWKNQMVLALGISNTKRALASQQAVTNLTNDMLAKNSETLKQGSIDIAKEAEKSIVDVQVLKKTNQDILETIGSIIQIHEDGRAKREAAEVELANIEKELKDKILEINIKN